MSFLSRPSTRLTCNTLFIAFSSYFWHTILGEGSCCTVGKLGLVRKSKHSNIDPHLCICISVHTALIYINCCIHLPEHRSLSVSLLRSFPFPLSISFSFSLFLSVLSLSSFLSSPFHLSLLTIKCSKIHIEKFNTFSEQSNDIKEIKH